MTGWNWIILIFNSEQSSHFFFLWKTEITCRNPIKPETAYNISWKGWYAQASNIKNHQMIRKNTNIIVIVKGGEIYGTKRYK